MPEKKRKFCCTYSGARRTDDDGSQRKSREAIEGTRGTKTKAGLARVGVARQEPTVRPAHKIKAKGDKNAQDAEKLGVEGGKGCTVWHE